MSSEDLEQVIAEHSDEVAAQLRENDALESYSDIDRYAECRCGEPVIVKSLQDQLFMNYSDQEWKEKVKETVEGLETSPPEYQDELPDIIDWLEDRPVTRQRGIGTPYPSNEDLVIEPLADSTVYMSFFPLVKEVNEGELSFDDINDSLLDYVLLGEGSPEDISNVENEYLNDLREEFQAIYPLDVNFAGTEHRQVHLPFMLFHHQDIFPEEDWPQGISINGHVTIDGNKMSKSKGNYVDLQEAVEEYGVDPTRLYLLSGASTSKDFDWTSDEIEQTVTRLNRFEGLIDQVLEVDSNEQDAHLDEWLNSRLNKGINEATEFMEDRELRKASEVIFSDLSSDLAWYNDRGGKNTEVVESYVSDLLSMAYPFTPNLAEERTEDITWPESDMSNVNDRVERLEDEVKSVITDINNITENIGDRDNAFLYVVSDDEKEVLMDATQILADRTPIENFEIFQVSEDGIHDPENKREVAKFGRPGVHLED